MSTSLLYHEFGVRGYPCAPVGWPKTGTWKVDAKRFPRGLKAIGDHAHSKDVKSKVIRQDPATPQYQPRLILLGNLRSWRKH